MPPDEAECKCALERAEENPVAARKRVEEKPPPTSLAPGEANKIEVGSVAAVCPPASACLNVSLDTLITHSARVNRNLTNHRLPRVSLVIAAFFSLFLSRLVRLKHLPLLGDK